MAFAAKSMGKHKVRIAGGNLAVSGVLKIGLNGDVTADIQLPASFPKVPDQQAAAQNLALEDIVSVNVRPVGVLAHPFLVHHTKGGAPWQVVVTSDDAANATPNLEIDVEYQHSNRPVSPWASRSCRSF